MSSHKIDWRSIPMPSVFDQDFKAWLKMHPFEAVMSWQMLGPYAQCAYACHCDLGSQFAYLVSKGMMSRALPDECTPAGLYRMATETRCMQVGKRYDELDTTPYCDLSPFSQFLHTRMADRLRAIAEPVDDGLDF